MEEMEKQKHILINHYNAGVPLLTKSNAWYDTLKRVNAISTCHRELAEVKKKWSDLKTEVRRKMSQARATVEGEGDVSTPPVMLTPLQQRICNLLGESAILSLPTQECPADMPAQVSISSPGNVALSQSEWPQFSTMPTMGANGFLIQRITNVDSRLVAHPHPGLL